MMNVWSLYNFLFNFCTDIFNRSEFKKKKILIYFDYFLFHFNFFPYADVHLFKASTWDRESCFLKV